MMATFQHTAALRPKPTPTRQGRSFAGRCSVLLGLLIAIIAFPAAARADAILNECSQVALQSALGVGGHITVNCDGTIVLTNTMTIAQDAILDAAGHRLTISGITGTNAINSPRLFFVNPGVHFSLTNVNLTAGRATNGGAIYNNRGFLSLDLCVLSNNLAIGFSGRDGARGKDTDFLAGGDGRNGGNGLSAYGGAIYNYHGTTFVIRCSILTNTVAAGWGGDGGVGGNGSTRGGNGGKGGSGGKAQGGAIYNIGYLVISNSTFQLNSTFGGNGGAGGTNGTGLVDSELGHGGSGGVAGGGAIYNLGGGILEVYNSTFTLNNVLAGDSANEGSDRIRAPGGKKGGSSVGGAIANYGVGSMVNSTFFGNKTLGGAGGNGASSRFRGGSGGDGGVAWGGNLYNAKRTAVTNCTFFDGGATGGTNGLGGAAAIAGNNGHRGPSRGGNLANANGTFILKNSLIAFALPGTNGYGAFSDAGYNLSSDRSIRLKGVGSRTNTDPRIALLGRNGGFTETIPLLSDSPAIDAADPVNRAPTDQRGVGRPYGSRSDIGAYEYGLTLLPPAITTQPQPQTAQAGATVSFIVVVQGDPPLTYLWRRGGNAITDTAGPVLTLHNIQTGDALNYDVVISNNSGSTTSSNAALTLITPVAITTQPIDMTIAQGGTTILRVSAAGDAPLGFQWYFNGTAIIGATLNSYTLSNIATNQAGIYSVLVYNSFSSVRSTNATVTITTIAPVIKTQPENATILPDETGMFSVEALGSLPMQYLWYQNTTNLVGSFLLNSNRSTLTITNAQPSNAGVYQAVVTNISGSITSQPATLVVAAFPPSISQQPTDLTVPQGRVATFRVTASGTSPLYYQWLFNGTTRIPGGTGPVLTIPNAGDPDVGSYSVVVSNRFGTITSDPAMLTVTFAPPEITTQPVDVTVYTGENATFSVTADGSLPISYQWYHEGLAIQGANNPSLTISNASSGVDGGHYYVTIANIAGSVDSDTVNLQIDDAEPIVITSPTNVAVLLGSNVTFTVAAEGSRPFTYQWRLNDVDIPDATNATLVVSNVTIADGGDYTVAIANAVTIDNGFPPTLSNPATLTLLSPFTPPDCTPDDPISCTISFDSEVGLDYTLEWFNMDSEEWEPLETLSGDGSRMHFTDMPSISPEVPEYRVVVEATPDP